VDCKHNKVELISWKESHVVKHVLMLVLLVGATAPAIAQRVPRDQTLASMRTQFADAGVDGRFGERFTGSYVFVPLRTDWPQLPVTNPQRLGVLSVGPPVRVRGQVDTDGRLLVTSVGLTPPTAAQSPWLRATTSQMVEFLERSVNAPTGAMDVDARKLNLPKDRDEARAAIARIVKGYAEAVEQKNEPRRRELVADWANLRTAFVDAYRDSQEAKAIYGGLDNYHHWRYQMIFNQAPSVVAIGEPGNSRSLCSGVLIAPGMLLTAAHCFSGPPPRFPNQLEAWFGYVDSQIPGKTAVFSRRKIVELVAPTPAEQKTVMAGVFNGAFPDYAIVRLEPLKQGELEPPPLCLREFDMPRGEALYVLGYPQGYPVMVHDSARVYLPHRVLESEFLRLQLDVEADALRAGSDVAAVMVEFANSYVPIKNEGMYELQHVRDNGQPRIGIIADTFQGNSGGPVFDHERNQCVVGILSDGVGDSGLRRTANWKEHERVLPISVVIADLRRRSISLLLKIE
jgi:hypothetical protein